MKTLIEYLRHESTWRGIIALAAGFGITLTPEAANAIIAAGLSLIGLINIFKKN